MWRKFLGQLQTLRDRTCCQVHTTFLFLGLTQIPLNCINHKNNIPGTVVRFLSCTCWNMRPATWIFKFHLGYLWPCLLHMFVPFNRFDGYSPWCGCSGDPHGSLWINGRYGLSYRFGTTCELQLVKTRWSSSQGFQYSRCELRTVIVYVILWCMSFNVFVHHVSVTSNTLLSNWCTQLYKL